MTQDKDTEKGKTKRSKNKSENALAEKGSDALKTVQKSPLMPIEKESKPPESEEDDTKVEIKTAEAKEELDVDTMKASLDEKSKLAEEYYDKLLRTQAEFENYKKRTQKELNEFTTYATAQLVKDILVVLDDFQNALTSCEEGTDSGFKKGIELIHNNLLTILSKEGLDIIKAENEKFDPWQHEAVEMVPTGDYPENTVIGVIQPGYRFKDKVLRPAKVRVATPPKMEEDKLKDEDKDND